MTFDTGRGWPQRRAPLRRAGSLRPVSKKRAAVNRARRAALLAAYGQHPACHACGPLQLVGVDRARTGCNGRADDAHELTSRARSRSDANLVDPAGIIPVSRSCHAFITANPDIAEAAGLALPSADHLRP